MLGSSMGEAQKHDVKADTYDHTARFYVYDTSEKDDVIDESGVVVIWSWLVTGSDCKW